MKILKVLLIIILSVVGIVLITALFVDKEATVEKEVIIDKPEQEVFDYIKMLKNQDNYSVWAAMDPGMKKEYSGTDGTVGFVSSWDGKKSGKGEQEITSITEGERIEYDLRFMEPWESTAKTFMATEPVSETQTKVKWGFTTRMSYPSNIMGLFMNASIGSDFQEGLNTLKKKLEE